MNAVEFRLGFGYYSPAAADLLQYIHTARVRNGQQPASVAMDAAAAAAAVANVTIVVVRRCKTSDFPVGKIYRTATFKLYK